MSEVMLTFEQWARRWLDLGRFCGSHLQEPALRAEQVLRLCDEPIPGSWKRGVDPQLLKARYRRGDVCSPRRGEHEIEHEMLCQTGRVRCLDGTLVDGINAMPLALDVSGVEADLFLLVDNEGSYHLVICELKAEDSADTCWYAAIENLRQLRLLQDSTHARQLFHYREPGLSLPADIPIIGLVVAPERYYSQPGKQSNVLPHTIRLLSEFTQKTRVEAHLATWDAGQGIIAIYRPTT